MNKIVSAFITYNGTPQVNLTPLPTISVYNAVTNAVVVANQDMEEIGGGFYKYTVVGYDDSVEYLFLTDSGTSFPDSERYYYGTLAQIDDADAAKLTDNILNAPVNVTFSPNSLGELLQGIDTSIGISLDLLNLLVKYQANRTKIDSSAKTLTIYDDNGTTPLKVFNLFDDHGVLSIDSVFERMPQ